jgi:hypothetical protein
MSLELSFLEAGSSIKFFIVSTIFGHGQDALAGWRICNQWHFSSQNRARAPNDSIPLAGQGVRMDSVAAALTPWA